MTTLRTHTRAALGAATNTMHTAHAGIPTNCSNPTPWTIEAATASTLPEASRFVNASRKELFPSKGHDPLLDDAAVLEEGCVLLARGEDGGVVAAIAYTPFDYRFPQLPPPLGSASSTPPSTANSSSSSLVTSVSLSERPCKTVEVVRLFVLPQYRRHGLAASLFKSLRAYALASGVQCLYLHTHPFLPGAIQFWEKQGFQLISIDTEDEVWRTHHMWSMLDDTSLRSR